MVFNSIDVVLLDEENNKADRVEGIVSDSAILNLGESNFIDNPVFGGQVMQLKLKDSYSSCEESYLVPRASYRIDAGERVVLYFFTNFKLKNYEMHIDGGGKLVDAVRVLDQEGLEKFRALHRQGVKFEKVQIGGIKK